MGRSIVLTTEKNVSVIITEENPRTIHVSPAHADYEVLDSEGNIESINYGGEYKIHKNKTINLNKTKYKLTNIKKIKATANKPAYYKLITNNGLTKTFNFIMPLLGDNRAFFKFSTQFVNAFIGYEPYGDYGDSIYLLYRFSGQLDYIKFEEQLMEHPWYKETVDVDKYQVLYQFDIPEEHKKDVNLLIKGKYSSVSVSTKERILRFHNSRETSTLGQILSKSPIRKESLEKDLLLDTPIPEDVDLYSVFYHGDEIFRNHLRLDNSKLDNNKLDE